MKNIIFTFFLTISPVLFYAQELLIEELIPKKTENNTIYYYQGKPYDGKAYILFPNSQKKSRVLNFKNGLIEGNLIYYFPNGSIKKITKYTKGKVTLEKKEYLKNGKLIYEFKYKKKGDENIGYISSSYFEDGTIKNFNDISFDEEKGGYGIMYHKNNKIKSKYKYICRELERENDITIVLTYHGAFSTYYESGLKESEGYYHNNLLNDKQKKYYQNGILKSEKTYSKGLLNGKSIEYYESGSKKNENHYSNDKLNGKSIKYCDESEKMIFEGQYVDGFLDGILIEKYCDDWPEPGLPEVSIRYKETTYKKGKKHGVEKYFGDPRNPNGYYIELKNWKNDFLDGAILKYKIINNDTSLILSGNYNSGLRVGKWIRYDSNNNKELELNFLDEKNEIILYGESNFIKYKGDLPPKQSYNFYYQVNDIYYEVLVSKVYFYSDKASSSKLPNLHFDNLNKIGHWEYYYDNGNIERKGNFTNDFCVNGDWTYYFSNGKIKAKGEYARDNCYHECDDISAYGCNEYKRTGKWDFKSECGDTLIKGEYKMGDGDRYSSGWWKTYVNGLLVKENNRNSKNCNLDCYLYSYDNKKRLKTKRKINKKKVLIKYQYDYFDNGNKKKVVFWSPKLKNEIYYYDNGFKAIEINQKYLTDKYGRQIDKYEKKCFDKNGKPVKCRKLKKINYLKEFL